MTTHLFPRFTDGPDIPRVRRAGRRAAVALLLVAGLFAAVPATTGEAVAATSICLNGKLVFDHADAEGGTAKPVVTLPARGAAWDLWGRTGSTGSSQWLTGSTTWTDDGHFNACYDAAAPLQDVFIRFRSTSWLWQVIKSTTDQSQYSFDTTHIASLGASQDIGTVKVPAEMQRAWSIIDTVNQLWSKRANPSTECWTRHQVWGACDMLTYVWSQNAASGGYWDPGTKYVIMNGNQPDSRHFILHEAGHWFMWRLYNRSFPAVTNCNPHYITKASSTSCAWTEGFADAVAAYSMGDYRYVYDDGNETSIANDKNSAGWDQGDTVQGRVGASLLDFWAVNGPDGGNWNRDIDLMSRQSSQDFKDYFTVARPSAVPALSTTGTAKTIIDGHTITY
ncbi:metalloprotease [Amycolatopsis sp. cmx-4-61]|uniref:metalloprotease n=1 Tax=Amycolatopsis sp. cmx-4-61 TaxID=2790937 RepID=UPI00397DEC73